MGNYDIVGVLATFWPFAPLGRAARRRLVRVSATEAADDVGMAEAARTLRSSSVDDVPC
jgi:hypothetical protein